jgi:cytochrome c biogenesis factor
MDNERNISSAINHLYIILFIFSIVLSLKFFYSRDFDLMNAVNHTIRGGEQRVSRE